MALKLFLLQSKQILAEALTFFWSDFLIVQSKKVINERVEGMFCSDGGLLHLNADDLVKLLGPEGDAPLVAAVDVVGSQLRQTIRTFI